MRADRFDSFVAIDWSGAKGARQKGIAIAVCSGGSAAPRLVRPGHRWSRSEVLDWLLTDTPPNALIGFDLSPGLPFVDEQAFFPGWIASPATARDLWRLVDEVSANDENLAVTSFVTHPEAWRHFRHGKGRCGDRFRPGPGRMRLTEERQREHRLAPSSCFNLVGAAQVGKSSLTGMRLFHRLGGAIPLWPFDPVPETGPVIVEIYTSLAARRAGIRPGRSKMLTRTELDLALGELGVGQHEELTAYTDHATDAILTSAWLRMAASDAKLWNPPGLDRVATTEGWTFGVR